MKDAHPFPELRPAGQEWRQSRTAASCRSILDWERYLDRHSPARAPCRKWGNCPDPVREPPDAWGRCKRRRRIPLAVHLCVWPKTSRAVWRTWPDSRPSRNNKYAWNGCGYAPISPDRASSRRPGRFHLMVLAAAARGFNLRQTLEGGYPVGVYRAHADGCQEFRP